VKLLPSVQLSRVVSHLISCLAKALKQCKELACSFTIISNRSASFKDFNKLKGDKAKRTVVVVDNEVDTERKHEKLPLSSK